MSPIFPVTCYLVPGVKVYKQFSKLNPKADLKARENLLLIPPPTNILGIRNESFNFPFRYDNTQNDFFK